MAVSFSHSTAPMPPRISHYTTLAGLQGIVESGQLWASNVSFLNDRRELEHGLDASLAALKIVVKDRAYKHWHDALTAAADALEKGVVPNTYAACFCERPDVLSQWRGYGGAEQGVSITFGRSELKAVLKGYKAQLHRVIYGNLSTRERMRQALKESLADLDEMEEMLGESSDSEKKRAAHKMICRLLPQFKHLGFKDERELRFVVQHETLRDGVCFRANKNVLVPYLKLGDEGGKLPVQSVTVGPGRDQALTQKSVKLYLEKHGYSDTNVVLSTVPFRT